jgi:2-keto-4-pentenoate hydratase/2-oxohepta-3-ene-1,7-dioic acid hydratase in catechol pathway
MRLVRFNRNVEAPALARVGVVLPSDIVADLRAGYASFLHHFGDASAIDIAAVRVPKSVGALLASGTLDRPELGDAIRWLADRTAMDIEAGGLHGETLFTRLADCRLHAPIRLTNLIVAHDNYSPPPVTPTFTMKPSIAVVGPARDIRLPKDAHQLQCEAGLAVVIGSACKDIAESDAAAAISGYFVMTNVFKVGVKGAADLSSFESGMYESFAPSGPWLVTKDEIVEAGNLKVEMRVNGDVRRQFSTASMTWPIERLVAFLSRMSLQPGDVIWTGGVSPGRDEPGVRLADLVESSVERVGVIRNRVVN